MVKQDEQLLDEISLKTDEEIAEEFDYLVQNELSEEEFWKWVSSWYDGESVIRTTRDWDFETKKEELIKIKEIIKQRK